jgi:ribosomal protein S18 acetylase RimI-like enzyme
VDLWEEMIEHHRTLSNQFELSDDGREKFSKYLAKKFSEKSTKLLVASRNGEIIGFMLCLLSPNVPVFKERTIGVVSDVYVRPEFRRQGITKEMLKVAIRWFHKNKVVTVQLNVAAANIEARTVWNQLGFQAHMIMKRLDLDEEAALELLEEEPEILSGKVVKKVRKQAKKGKD